MTDGFDGNRFLIINKKRDWEQGLLDSLMAFDEEGLTLKKTFDYTNERSIYVQVHEPSLDIKDLTLDDSGLLYLLDSNTRTIYTFDPKQDRFKKVDAIETLFSNPVCITFAQGNIYVVDHEAEHVIFNFSSTEWEIRWKIGRFKDALGNELGLGNFIKPIDLVVDKYRNLYVLDQNNLAILQFDHAGSLVSIFGQEELKGKQPVAISLSPDGALFVLERKEKIVLRFISNKFDRQFKTPIDIDPSGLSIDTNGFLFIGDQRNIISNEEDDRFIYQLNPFKNQLNAISGYRGSVSKIMIDLENRLYVFEKKEQNITILKRQRVYLKYGSTPVYKGIYFSIAFDSKKEGTKWHKLVLERQTLDNNDQIVTGSENIQVKVSYRISDHKTIFIKGEEKNLDDFLKDPNVVHENKVTTLNQLDWSKPLINPKDMLINGSRGRYIWMRVELIGNEKLTPAVKSIRAVFPRSSYLRYLPAIYQEDERSRDFLERFLSLFETFFSDLDSEIEHIARFFDADAVSGDFLRWLSTWLSITVDDRWPEDKLRMLIKKAPELYKMRGTRRGIEEITKIFTGQRPIITEAFQLPDYEQNDADPYTFYVYLPPFPLKDEYQIETVRKILELEKPAHTYGELSVLKPCIILDKQTYLGVNTYL